MVGFGNMEFLKKFMRKLSMKCLESDIIFINQQQVTKMFRKLYLNPYFRIPLKFTISMTIVKVLLDLYAYCTRDHKFGIPRTMNMYSAQNTINAPIPQPYPYADTYQHLQDIKLFREYTRALFDTVYRNFHRQNHLFVDQPCRQNPDQIDHFVQYGNLYRVQQFINYTFINKLKSEGIQIPDGINQRIRELEQWRLDFHRPITPQL